MNRGQEHSGVSVAALVALGVLAALIAVWLLVAKGRSASTESAERSTGPSQANENPSSPAGAASLSSRVSRNSTGDAVFSPSVVTHSSGEALPERVNSWLGQGLARESFAAGIALLRDPSLSERARVLILDKLHSWRRSLPPESLKVLLAETESIAKDAAQPKDIRARAVNAMATILIVLQEQALFTPAEVKAYFPFLAELAQAKEGDVLVRGRAIRALGVLKAESAGPMLRELLAVPENVNNQELARNACLALAQVDGEIAVPAIERVLETTRDEAVFGTAAFALGQVQTPESLASLVRHEARFPRTGSVDAAVVNMEDLILRLLQKPDDANIGYAIEATRHLWKDGQRERYTPLLRSLLGNSPLAAQQAAVSRLIEDSRSLPLEREQQALSAILAAVANHPELADYVHQIQTRLNARPLVPNAAPIPTVGRTRQGEGL